VKRKGVGGPRRIGAEGYGRRKIRRKNRRWDLKKCGRGEKWGEIKQLCL